MDIMIWEPLFRSLSQKKQAQGEHSLSKDERLWLLLRRHIDEVEENSVIGFYCGDQAFYVHDIIAAWQSLGMEEMANVFERGNALFAGGGFPENDEERDALIEAWQDQEYQKIFRELDEDFEQALPRAEVALDQVARRILAKTKI
ncbi:MAG: DMP19 family protein [Firmicutes bacterium]|nr:DMP19 family protein [Bacillota bacterium]